jgi:hypothetical protein
MSTRWCGSLFLLAGCAALPAERLTAPFEPAQAPRAQPLAFAGAAQERDPPPPAANVDPLRTEGAFFLSGGLGFTLDPDTFLLSLGASYGIIDYVTIGQLVQLGVADERTVVAPTLNAELSFDLGDLSRQLQPFVHAGVGLAYINKEERGRVRDGIGFLVNAGGGARYWLTPSFALGSTVLFNFLPAETVDENIFFSWQVVTATVRF